MDELFLFDPEPCETCKTGVAMFVCYDDVQRCKKCVRAYADERGWNNIVIPIEKKKRVKRGPDANQRTMDV